MVFIVVPTTNGWRMVDLAFAGIPLPHRAEKPRRTGISMMIDWGMGLARQADTLEIAGHYIDLAKIAGPISRLLERRLLVEKLALYRRHAVATSIGGLFVELAWSQGTYDRLLAEAGAVGFDAIEVSDNLIRFAAGQKARAIRQALDAGLAVYGEVGRKEGHMDDDAVIADIADCLDAGSRAVFVEAHELFADGDVRAALIERIGRTFPAERIIYELPVVILPGVHREYKHRITAWLVRTLGTEVNLANIEWDELFVTEGVRRGAGGETGHAGGAYALAGVVDGS